MAKSYFEYDPQILRRLQLVQLDMLKDVDALCEKHGIDYFVHYGCAIGALRHGGFIPWDDDVDLCMMRADTERFYEVAHADDEFMRKYDVMRPGSDEYPYIFLKVAKKGTRFIADEMKYAGLEWGIYMDIFQLDVVPEELKESRKKSFKTLILAKLLYLYCFEDPHVPASGWKAAVLSAGCRVAHHLIRLLPFMRPSKLQKVYRDICSKESPTPDSKYTVYSGTFNHETRKMRYDEYFPTVLVPFENTKIRLPNQYDRLLRAVYGDYMKMPPMEQRRNHMPEVLDFGDER